MLVMMCMLNYTITETEAPCVLVCLATFGTHTILVCLNSNCTSCRGRGSHRLAQQFLAWVLWRERPQASLKPCCCFRPKPMQVKVNQLLLGEYCHTL